ncbi:brassinosteroid-related acyltransferase 1-like [Zingiber officinale]|uniref:Uncharacterized protein n=1 Tax=Zingiber officinale TaxID=94328 RepID=A0A8J5H8J7_ZINOF|nr:brassinosteroid-related acyltransferase 1-like [Zingiber officinale]KAG6511710.1 hypothetical protein ZIOFF_029787 [Zingiber officinale]
MASCKRDQEQHYHEVFITKTVTIQPPPLVASPTFLPLSNLDSQCPALMYLVFFYREPVPASSSSSSSLFSSLKRGLEEALASWYPAAGRLRLSSHSGKFTLACRNGTGALLLQASTTARISDLGDLSQPNNFVDRLVFRPPLNASLEDTPLVVGQVTKFGCGGYAIGVGTNHALFDGVANYNFLNAWAGRAAGRRLQAMPPGQAEPVHDRGRLLELHGHQHGHDDDPAEFMAIDHLHQLIKQKQDPIILRNGEEKLVLRTFSVECAMVSRLKSKAMSGGTANCSSFEVVAAHMWKARTKALNIPNHRTVCLQFTVDARGRMHPPLPPSFAGNAFVLSSLLCTAAELDRLPLAALVLRIQAAKRAVTHAYVARYIAALGEAPRTSLPPLPELTMVSDWTKTPYHRVDFGAGEAAYVAPLATPMPQAAYFMQSPGEAGSVDVRIGLPEKTLSAFETYFLHGF